MTLTSNADPSPELGGLELTEKDTLQLRMGALSLSFVREFPCATDDHAFLPPHA